MRIGLLLLLPLLAGCTKDAAAPAAPAPEPGPPSASVASTYVRSYFARIEWAVENVASAALEIQRRHDHDPWKRWALIVPDDGGRIVLEDRSVQPGRPYTYRVRIGGQLWLFGGEVSIVVPQDVGGG